MKPSKDKCCFPARLPVSCFLRTSDQLTASCSLISITLRLPAHLFLPIPLPDHYICFVLLAYTKFTLPQLGSGAEKPSGSEGINLSFVNLFDHLSWCYIITREITLLTINAQRMGSDTAAVVIYLGLLVPDTSTGPRKLLSEGFTAMSVQMKAAWPSHKVQTRKMQVPIPTRPSAEVAGKVWGGWSSKFVLYIYIK